MLTVKYNIQLKSIMERFFYHSSSNSDSLVISHIVLWIERKLDKLWATLAAARRSPQKGSDLEVLAKMAERKEQAGGNHPMWISPFPQHRAFPIERHGGNPELSPHVRKVALNHLEADAAAWEDWLEETKENGE